MADLKKLLDEAEKVSDLRQVVGALVFSSPVPLGIDAIRKCLRTSFQEGKEGPSPFAKVLPRDIHVALQDIGRELERLGVGIELREVAGGYRFQTQAEAGPWVRSLLKKDKPARLSPAMLETLAIIAYRQPIAKSEIEGIRGVTVDHVVRALMEMHLIRMIGRSDLPGHPFLYGTTPLFLEHFGLRSLEELDDIDPTLKREEASPARRRRKTSAKPAGESAQQELAALTAAVDGEDSPSPPAPPAAGEAIERTAAPVYSIGAEDDAEEAVPRPGSVVFIQGATEEEVDPEDDEPRGDDDDPSPEHDDDLSPDDDGPSDF